MLGLLDRSGCFDEDTVLCLEGREGCLELFVHPDFSETADDSVTMGGAVRERTGYAVSSFPERMKDDACQVMRGRMYVRAGRSLTQEDANEALQWWDCVQI